MQCQCPNSVYERARAEKAEAERDAVAKTADMRYREMVRCQPIHEALVTERDHLRAEVESLRGKVARLAVERDGLEAERDKLRAEGESLKGK